MKAFFVGLLFLVAAGILAGLGILLSPLLLALAFALRLVLGIILVVLAIWLLGKFIIFVWESVKD